MLIDLYNYLVNLFHPHQSTVVILDGEGYRSL